MKSIALALSALLLATGCGGETKDEAVADTSARTVAEADSVADKTAPAPLVVYYFHTNYRCHTCTMFERVTREIIGDDFADDVGAGRLELKIVNVEEPQNKHFIEQYRLTTKSVVLSVRGDARENWTNLDRIWQLARNESKLREYIRGAVEQQLEELKG